MTWPWQSGLRGNAVVLLGEVHDNALLHRQRSAVLRSALQAGWRPALAREQFDTDSQSKIEEARRRQPGESATTVAQRVIDRAAGNQSGWDWASYRPFVELAVEFDLPLLAANLARKDANTIVRQGFGAVFDTERLRALGLADAPSATLQAAQENEVRIGHCDALPVTLLPAMARAQLARDAVMADLLQRNAATGVVLLAGNGHARKDIGVPRWLAALPPGRVLSVGYLEEGDSPVPEGSFDAVVRTPRAQRADPCEAFLKGRGKPT